MSEDDAPRTLAITLTDEEAVALYHYLESDECPNWWETPLAPLHRPVRDWHRYESPICDV